jgi:hypothetical protein
MLRAAWVGALVASSVLVGCGAEPPEPGQPAEGSFSLVSTYTTARGIDLETGSLTIVDVGNHDVDFWLSIRLTYYLQLGTGAGFCSRGSGFADVAAIPGEADDCSFGDPVDFGPAVVGGDPEERGVGSREGYLARSRRGSLYRVLFTDHRVSGQNDVATVTFDVLPVD